ncbi:hypothetical protein BDQ94DRAFT_44253 [Aspergillus welwitschiae]|uniref:Uncharacterized protein n=1 Tax=Aspergillus welwitschiae TaxID=1341132 RepID=A0A3F3QHM0_9EURO|nr:hypothetical protein BDQ94DRAFT_44253 [Aspergillus welwitschiae]RDH38459.1 hypothetical protein BDQ94DRAFT_44253 [Aspergillus welwitschiae]
MVRIHSSFSSPPQSGFLYSLLHLRLSINVASAQPHLRHRTNNTTLFSLSPSPFSHLPTNKSLLAIRSVTYSYLRRNQSVHPSHHKNNYSTDKSIPTTSPPQ